MTTARRSERGRVWRATPITLASPSSLGQLSRVAGLDRRGASRERCTAPYRPWQRNAKPRTNLTCSHRKGTGLTAFLASRVFWRIWRLQAGGCVLRGSFGQGCGKWRALRIDCVHDDRGRLHPWGRRRMRRRGVECAFASAIATATRLPRGTARDQTSFRVPRRPDRPVSAALPMARTLERKGVAEARCL